MVSGHAPIQAHKIRYYQDSNFKHRVLAPPILSMEGYADTPAQRPDDWSGLAFRRHSSTPQANGNLDSSALMDDGGLQRQPELAEVDVNFEPESVEADLALLDDDDAPLPVPDQVQRRMQRTARLAALDPDDGIAL